MKIAVAHETKKEHYTHEEATARKERYEAEAELALAALEMERARRRMHHLKNKETTVSKPKDER